MYMYIVCGPMYMYMHTYTYMYTYMHTYIVWHEDVFFPGKSGTNAIKVNKRIIYYY